MNNFFRTIIAAWGAKKMGGGCLSTIVIFVIIYVALGKCSNTHAAAATQVRPKVICQPGKQIQSITKDSLNNNATGQQAKVKGK